MGNINSVIITLYYITVHKVAILVTHTHSLQFKKKS
jgi:hypothetical protein